MFLGVILILLVVSFLLALRSTRTVNQKPEVKDVKRSLDKDRVIYHGHSSSSE